MIALQNEMIQLNAFFRYLLKYTILRDSRQFAWLKVVLLTYLYFHFYFLFRIFHTHV